MSADVICWHCGWRIPGDGGGHDHDAGATRGLAAVPSISFRRAAVYGLLTLAIAVALLLVIRSLGRLPLVVSNPSAPLESGWSAIVLHDRRFAFSLPADWSWEETSDGDHLGILSGIPNESLPLREVLSVYGESPSEMRILMVAASEPAIDKAALPAFAFIAQDVRSSHLNPSQAVALLQEDSEAYGLLRAVLTQESSGEFHGAFLVELVDRGYQCEQKFTSGPRGSFLVAACAINAQLSSYSEILPAIVDSFEWVTG